MMINNNRYKDKKIFRWQREFLAICLIIFIWPTICLACPVKGEVKGYSTYLSGKIRSVDMGGLVLDNGQVITLPGIWHPESGPLAKKLRQAKRKLIGQTITIYTAGKAVDRYGRVAGLPKLDGQWLHLQWLCDGMVIRNGALNHPIFRQVENSARKNNKGLWINPYFFHPADDYVDRKVGYLTVIHGKLREVARIRDTIYLNFGDDWKTDTTAAITGDAITRVQETHGDLMALTGQEIEIRGVLQLYNGPYIQINHPGQLTAGPPINQYD
jgi:hypothetical protein